MANEKNLWNKIKAAVGLEATTENAETTATVEELEKIEQAVSETGELKAQVETLEAKVAEQETQISAGANAQQELEQTQATLKTKESELATANARITELEAELKTANDDLAKHQPENTSVTPGTGDNGGGEAASDEFRCAADEELDQMMAEMPQ